MRSTRRILALGLWVLTLAVAPLPLLAQQDNRLPADTLGRGRVGSQVSSRPPKHVWPTGALLRSAFVPGWGQIYNRQYIKAVLYGGTEIVLAYQAAINWRKMDSHQRNFTRSTDPYYKSVEFHAYEQTRDRRNLYLWLTALTVFVSMFDAYVDAHLANFEQSDPAFEARFRPADYGVALVLTYTF